MHCEVAILGSGPAGLALSRELARRGTRVICISPEIHQVWAHNYGVWSHELTDNLKNVVEYTWESPSVWTGDEETSLSARYCRIDTPGLQRNLKSAAESLGVQFREDAAASVEHHDDGSVIRMNSGDEVSARFVVDATGARGHFLEREQSEEVAFQTAFGQLLEVDAHPLFEGEMVFMDFRALPGDDRRSPPTFLYAMPMGPKRIFVEETSLISAPAVPLELLENRLGKRLEVMGIRGANVLDEERCKFPLNLAMPSLKQRTLGFGLAAAMVHPASGYQLARTMMRVNDVADAICEGLKDGDIDEHSARIWRAVWPKEDLMKWDLFSFGSRFLQTLDANETRRFFEAFFSIPDADWQGYLSGTTTMAQVASVMAKVFYKLGPNLRWKIMRRGASLEGLSLLGAAVSR